MRPVKREKRVIARNSYAFMVSLKKENKNSWKFPIPGSSLELFLELLELLLGFLAACSRLL
jgi:hypothetical protein